MQQHVLHNEYFIRGIAENVSAIDKQVLDTKQQVLDLERVNKATENKVGIAHIFCKKYLLIFSGFLLYQEKSAYVPGQPF